jgi:hypothetical protein
MSTGAERSIVQFINITKRTRSDSSYIHSSNKPMWSCIKCPCTRTTWLRPWHLRYSLSPQLVIRTGQPEQPCFPVCRCPATTEKMVLPSLCKSPIRACDACYSVPCAMLVRTCQFLVRVTSLQRPVRPVLPEGDSSRPGAITRLSQARS